MEKKWSYKIDCRNMDPTEIISAILDDRGIDDYSDFINPGEEYLLPFEDLRNIEFGAEIILNGIKNKNRFLVWKDVDTDGCTSGTIAEKWLLNKRVNVKTYINNGKEHGIGHPDFNLLKNIDIIWIVDSIETTMEPYEKLLNYGVKKIVITDHHLINRTLQKKIEDTGKIALISSAVDYPNPELSGSGVTWKLCQYMDWLEMDYYSDELTDLAACGIISDMTSVGLDSMENRYICNKGFRESTNSAIKEINGGFDFNSQAISFGIAPLVNAANRTDNNELARDVFSLNDRGDIKECIKSLRKCKEAQNEEANSVMEEIKRQAESQLGNKVIYFFIDTQYDIKGLIGNKALEIYQRPLMVLSKKITVDEETGEIEKITYTGSARADGVPNFKQYVDNTGLANTGGHENAFGVWFDEGVFDDLRMLLEDALKNVEFTQEKTADILINEEQINENLIDKIKTLNKISGKNFPPIKVMVKNVKNYEIGTMSKGKHLKLIAENGKLLYIKWNFSPDDFIKSSITVIGGLDSGFFGRTFYKQFIMDDWKYE